MTWEHAAWGLIALALALVAADLVFLVACIISIFVSILAVGVSVSNLLHFLKTEKRLREGRDE